MIEKKLMDFLCRETSPEQLGDEKLLHSCPDFGQAVGEAINGGRLIPFTVELGSHLKEMDLYKACLLSNFIGFACEKEENTSAGPDMIHLFAAACQNVYDLFCSTGAALPPDLPLLYKQNSTWAKAYCGFNILCISAMAFLSRDSGLRTLLAELELAEKIEFLIEETPNSPYLKSIYYVDTMLKTCSDLKLLVLQPGRRQGFYATANDLNNCFHLLFLLEEEIAQKCGEKYGANFQAEDPVIRLAHGEYPEEVWVYSYTTCFMECNYTTAGHENFQNDDAMAMIWGEMPPDCIPMVDGRAVIVLLNSGPTRSFDVSFLAVPHEALNPYVQIEEELSPEEYDAWMRKFK